MTDCHLIIYANTNVDAGSDMLVVAFRKIVYAGLTRPALIPFVRLEDQATILIRQSLKNACIFD